MQNSSWIHAKCILQMYTNACAHTPLKWKGWYIVPPPLHDYGCTQMHVLYCPTWQERKCSFEKQRSRACSMKSSQMEKHWSQHSSNSRQSSLQNSLPRCSHVRCNKKWTCIHEYTNARMLAKLQLRTCKLFTEEPFKVLARHPVQRARCRRMQNSSCIRTCFCPYYTKVLSWIFVLSKVLVADKIIWE